MPCYHPIRVTVWRKGLTRKVPDTLPVGCGHCLGCRADQARDWTVRLMHETHLHDDSWFITLTYDEEHLPETGSLAPAHLRTFVRDLRRDYPAQQISYFTCGEYGPQTDRAHYHAVLYGPPFLDRTPHPDPRRDQVWTSEYLDTRWGRGMAEISPVTQASAAYVAGYVQKKVRLADAPDTWSRVNPLTGEIIQIQPCFARMSLRPAIGKRWIEKFWQDVYPSDEVIIQGRKYPPPRYYDKWMDEHHPEVMYETRLKREREWKEERPGRRESAEIIHQGRLALYGDRHKL